jgi:outer membrane protein OmpU
MRKVLLATTALVALGGVSAASADVSLSASASWAYDSWSDDTAVGSAAATNTNNTAATMDSDFTISGSTTTDSGMSFGGSIHVDDAADDDARMHISDDWGQISFGEHNDAAKATSGGTSAFDAAISGGSSIPGNSATGTVTPMMARGMATSTVVGGEAKGQIMYTSPTVNGITLRVSQADAGQASKADTTAMGVVYTTSASDADITLTYAQTSTDAAGDLNTAVESEASGFGVKVVYGDFTVRASSSSAERSTQAGAIQSDTDTNEYGVTYAMSDTLTVEAVTMDSELGTNGTTSGTAGAAANEGAGDTYEASQIGVKYVPATGMYISLSNRSYEYKDANGSTNDGALTRLKVGVTF